jgi:hypothetical protein
MKMILKTRSSERYKFGGVQIIIEMPVRQIREHAEKLDLH